MKRILNYTIGTDAAGWSILRFLKEKHYSKNVIIQLKKTEEGICLNGKWAYISQILDAGDVLNIKLVETQAQNACPPVNLPFSTVYEDEDLIVINKPAGMPVHPSMGNHENTLANAVCYHAAKRQECYPYRCINRLDRDTSGLTVIAKNAYSSCILYEQMRRRMIQRTYYAIADGLTEEKGTIQAPIARKKDTVIERTVDFKNGAYAVTHFETLAYKDGLSFLKLTLETGRTHQIRVHMRYAGHPLIGDFLYHPSDCRMKRQALHAGSLKLLHPVSGHPLQFLAQLPEDMFQFFPVIIS